jgi:DNA modification methylase
MKHYEDDWLTVHLGDCREVLAGLEAESVHTVVTSPPYWGLRDYGTATWLGGDPECDHQRPNARMPHERRASTLGGGVATVAAQDAGANVEPTCGRCGAVREDAQLGLEPTPEAYVESMVAVFREVRRVLRSDGTVWLNLGDSYAAGASGGKQRGFREGLSEQGLSSWSTREEYGRVATAVSGLKPKDLVGIPWRVAFALQADGWYLRSDIIWAKPNPMPESVSDRPTKSHEYVFLLTKGPRYYFDADAVREPHTDSTLARVEYGLKHRHPDGVGIGIPPVDTERMGERFANPGGRNIRTVWTIAEAEEAGYEVVDRQPCPCGQCDHEYLVARERVDRPEASHEYLFLLTKSGRYYFDADAVREPSLDAYGGGTPVGAGRHDGPSFSGRPTEYERGTGRNIRSVWTIATQPYPGAHFATFPRKLVEPCILAGTSERGVCPECGAPWTRVVERLATSGRTAVNGAGNGELAANARFGDSASVTAGWQPPAVEPSAIDRYGTGEAGVHRKIGGEYQRWLDEHPKETTGWTGPCQHEGDPVPAVVLDPFAGSGTTGVVAQALGRRAVLVDLNGEYLVQLLERVASGRSAGEGPALDIPLPAPSGSLWENVP